ncbi:MAG: hypothetical protein M0T70_13440 [Geobacteraceae bacterium]|nr:hypothetical protein [Geobacteraceae bacterium]
MKDPRSITDQHCQFWLFGVPRKIATLWWRIIFWQDAVSGRHVPEHIRSKGMYCPVCRKGQPFADQCAFCQCAFPCFVIITTTTDSRNRRRVCQNTSRRAVCYGPSAPLHALRKRIGTVSVRKRVLAAGLLFIVLLAVGVGMTQYRRYEQRQYAHNYVQALYVINSGMHLGDMLCQGTYNDWRGVESSAVHEDSGIDPQARADLQSVKATIDNIMGALVTPSAEYNQAEQILQRIYDIYEKTNAMIVTSQDSLSRHTSEMDAAKAEFSREIENLKAHMPAPLAVELKKAGQKYDLRFISDGT